MEGDDPVAPRRGDRGGEATGPPHHGRGVVTLAGQVNDPEDRVQAERVARSVDGVVRVNNELQAKRPG